MNTRFFLTRLLNSTRLSDSPTVIWRSPPERDLTPGMENRTVSLDYGNTGNLHLTRPDRYLDLPGQRLRQALDRKQCVITGLIQALGLKPRPAGGLEAPPPGPAPAEDGFAPPEAGMEGAAAP